MDVYENLKEQQSGDYKIEKFCISGNDFRALLDGLIPGKEYIKLTYRGNVLMSNTPMEERTNFEFIKKAHGDILIGGLGIGLIVMAIQDKQDVESITVVEKASEVIQLLSSLPYNDKVTVVEGDVFSWKPERKYDTIYIDIWPYVNEDVYEKEMVPLKRRYQRYLKPKEESPNRFLRCWAEYEARRGLRL